MKRRSFLKTAVAGSLLAGAGALVQAETASPTFRQILELRRFKISSEPKRRFVTRFLKQAAIPALNRLGIKPVGVFYEMPDAGDDSITVLTGYPSVIRYLNVFQQLGEDEAFLEAAHDYLHTEKNDPAYDRVENWLLIAFSGFPAIKVPRRGQRLFELRTYESHNELKAALKIEMFNTAELDIFRKVHLEGVFFGQALVGPDLPQLTYMLVFKDQADREARWKAFGADPDWQTLRQEERYRDTVSKIHRRFLLPAPCSQI